MIKNRQECYPFVVLSPISPNVLDSTPVFFSFYDRNERRTTCFNASSAETTTRASRVSTSYVRNAAKKSSADPASQSRSEPSKPLTASAVRIVATSTTTTTRLTDGENHTDPEFDSAVIGTVFKRVTSFQMKG